MAIGARPAQVANIFFKRGVRLTLAGGVVGLLGAWELSGVLRSLLEWWSGGGWWVGGW